MVTESTIELRATTWGGGHPSIGQMMRNASNRMLEGFTTFTVIRHPCERFISAYNYLRYSVNDKLNEKWARKYIGNSSIGEFAQKLNTIQPLRVHFQNQFPMMFYSNGSFGIDLLFCTSQFNDGLKRLAAARSDVPRHLFPWSNNTKNHQKELSHGHCDALDSKTVKVIENFYAMDYCIFGFPKRGQGSTLAACSKLAAMSKDELTRVGADCARRFQYRGPLGG